jgi:outer membrane protein assembly factor BamD
MNRRLLCPILVALFVVLLPFRSPAPLIYTPGEGWSYEAVGSEGKWRRTRAKDQLEVAQEAFDAKDYGLALKASRRTVKEWTLSDYAPQAQYLVGRCYEARKMDEKAFKEYQKVIEKHPRSEKLPDVLNRQYEIANRFLDGQWYKLWNIPLYPSMERTAGLFQKIVTNAPFSEIAPDAQLKAGAAREKQKKYPEAVDAYERAADRYHDREQIASEALFRAGNAWNKQAKTSEYDQGAAGHAISTYTDFMTLYPDDKRVNEAANAISSLRTEQARGNFEIAKFYEKHNKWNGALIYYNEVLVRDPNSPYAPKARERIDAIKKRVQDKAG